MKTRLYFVRHGESMGNLEEKFNGHINFDLTERGHAQAECTAKYLDAYPIDVVYSSDLNRAFQTAEHTAKRRGLKVNGTEALREINGGKYEGMPYKEIIDHYPQEFYTWLHDIGNSACPGGESVADLQARVQKEVLRIVEENRGKNVLIATHATPIRVMTCIWNNIPLGEMIKTNWVNNASVTIVDYDENNQPEVVAYNLADHIGELNTFLPDDV